MAPPFCAEAEDWWGKGKGDGAEEAGPDGGRVGMGVGAEELAADAEELASKASMRKMSAAAGGRCSSRCSSVV
jgi:hypothetical protein